MKRIIVSILTISGLVLGGSSLAQTQNTSFSNGQDRKTWFGTSASLHYVIPSLDFHIGVEDALGENIDLRTTITGLYVEGGGFIGGSLNGIINLSDGFSSTNNYVGFGPRALLVYGDGTGNGILGLGLGGLWGAEFFSENSTRPFVELDASIPLTAGSEVVEAIFPILTLTTGVNFRF